MPLLLGDFFLRERSLSPIVVSLPASVSIGVAWIVVCVCGVGGWGGGGGGGGDRRGGEPSVCLQL